MGEGEVEGQTVSVMDGTYTTRGITGITETGHENDVVCSSVTGEKAIGCKASAGNPFSFPRARGSAKDRLAAIGCPPTQRPCLLLRPSREASRRASCKRRGNGVSTKVSALERQWARVANASDPYRTAVLHAAVGLPDRAW